MTRRCAIKGRLLRHRRAHLGKGDVLRGMNESAAYLVFANGTGRRQ
jgi:hypothetical protein